MTAQQHQRLSQHYRARFLQIGRTGLVANGAPMHKVRDYHELWRKSRRHEKAAAEARERESLVVSWWVL